LSNVSVDTEETPLHTNTADSMLRKNIRGQIYDSAPAYPKLDNGIAALEASGMMGNGSCFVCVVWIFKAIFVLAFVLESMWDRLHGRPHRLFQYWNDLWECDWDVPQGFIYSPTDRMTDATHLQTFIQHRRRLLGHHEHMVSVLECSDSPHVQHYRTHPEEYKAFVEQFLQRHLLYIRRKKFQSSQ
jgi:hypothetical protein